MRRFCPTCEELLKGTHNHNIGCCAGCGWTGPWKDAYSEPLLPVVKPRLPYVSIDIETTGLDPSKCQTLEIGAAIDDWTKPIEELPLFRRVMAWEEVVGSPYAMAMNFRLLKSIGNKPRDPELPPKEALEKWLNSMAAGGPRYLPLDAILSRLGEEPIYWYEIPNRMLEMSVDLPEVRALAGNPPETSSFCHDYELPGLFADWLNCAWRQPAQRASGRQELRQLRYAVPQSDTAIHEVHQLPTSRSRSRLAFLGGGRREVAR